MLLLHVFTFACGNCQTPLCAFCVLGPMCICADCVMHNMYFVGIFGYKLLFQISIFDGVYSGIGDDGVAGAGMCHARDIHSTIVSFFGWSKLKERECKLLSISVSFSDHFSFFFIFFFFFFFAYLRLHWQDKYVYSNEFKQSKRQWNGIKNQTCCAVGEKEYQKYTAKSH